MIKLEISQKKRLKQILENHPLIRSDDAGSRRVLLQELDVCKVCQNGLDLKASTDIFVSHLTTRLETEKASDGRACLWHFLNSFNEMYGDRVSREDRAFIEELIHSDDSFSERKLSRSDGSLIDKSIIDEFDLEDIEEAVIQVLRPRTGAFAFSLNVPDTHFCRMYVIERMKNVIKRKCGRKVEQKDVSILPNDCDNPISPISRLEAYLDSSILEWFNTLPHALLVCLWNHHAIPLENIFTECWRKIQEECAGTIAEQAHTLVLFSVSVNGPAVRLDDDRFRMLQLPIRFEEKEISAHFKPRLETAKINEFTIRWAIKEIMKGGGELFDTYGLMADIIKRLQGGFNPNGC